VFDIPTITVRVVEHRLISRRCACGALTYAAGPAGVTAPVQYGPHAAAITVYLRLGQHLPVKRTAGLQRDKEGIDAAGVLPAFTGTLVHDAFAPCAPLSRGDPRAMQRPPATRAHRGGRSPRTSSGRAGHAHRVGC